jgi:3',5'-cyclic AMP phosphodiesterase CpdA
MVADAAVDWLDQGVPDIPMRRVLLVLSFGLLILIAQKDPKVPEAELHRPGRMPDRLILTWAGNPATTQAATWRTDTTVARAVGQIAEAGDGPGFVKLAREVAAATERLTSDLGEALYHSVRFEALKPNTVYAYRVGDGFNWSEWNQFRTASDGPAPLTFLYVGDAQNDIWSLWSRLVRTGFAEAPRANFIIHAGDLVNRSIRDAEWGEWHQAAGWINRSLVSVPVPGNHEYPGDTGKKALAGHWRPQFTLLANGVKGLEETNYHIDIHGVRIVALNSNERQQEQAEWLDALLASNPNKWTVAAFHHPIFSAARGRDNKALREMWQPVFDKHGVDLVLTGHDHTYARTNLTTGANVRAGRAGTVYVVSVSGPKMYNLDREPWMARAAEDTQLAQVVRIDGDRLSFESRTARGVLYDAFELTKRKGKPNKLVNRVPGTPENRRAPEQRKESASLD